MENILLEQILEQYKKEEISFDKAQKLICVLLDASPSLRLADNDEIRKSFESTDNHSKPYGTTDGYINTLRANLRFNGLEIYKSNEG
jgi:hypothetical protein